MDSDTDSDYEYDYDYHYNNCVNSAWREMRSKFEEKTYFKLCIEEPLDTIISNKDSIDIIDERGDMYEYSSLPKYYKERYNNYLHIKSIDGKPITLEQVLNEMMDCNYYSKDNVFQTEYLNHIFLERINPKSRNSNQFELFLGS